ncbi:MAG: hypothetical protein GX442_23840 [Candidatus Riflebacteria bacterium]|nr:hypothetical protein [Candidatus Riflebacteria bacterium]
MEQIEFLAGTGVSFYSPEHDTRLTDALLSRTWTYRVLTSPAGHISLQLGEAPIQNALSATGQPLTDTGALAIRFQDALRAALRRWIPLPYTRKAGQAAAPSRSKDWIRLFISRPPLATDDQLHRFTFVVDTTIQPPLPADAPSQDCFGFFGDDVGLPFVPDVAALGFWQSPTLLTWLQSVFRDTLATGSDKVPAGAPPLAAFMTLVDGLRQAELLPEVTFLNPEGTEIPTHLVLDLGNSRACGIIAEAEPGKPINLDECRKLEIRNLREPSELYTEPFDTSFKFQPPLFFDPDNPVPHAGAGFRWPSLVRLGQEAARLDPCDLGDTGMSSPKRYLWDERERPFPWYYHLPGSGLGKKIAAPFLRFLDADGTFSGEKAHPPFEPCYPSAAMMTFVLVELLNHAYAQINSFAYRKHRGHRMARRVLKSIVMTTPNGMAPPEKERYRRRVQDAIDLYFHVTGRTGEARPELFMELDEATAVQLTYIYGEARHRHLGNARDMLAVLGRERTTPAGQKAPTLRLASIDIGGGTSDLMIAEYAPSGFDVAGVSQTMLFSEGFSVAGDDIAKRVIEKLVLPQVFAAAARQNPGLAREEFNALFGPGRGGRDKRFLDLKAELARQVWIPMAHRHLEFAELDTEEPVVELSFDRFFPNRLPSGNVLDFFAETMRKDLGATLTLPEIPWQISRRRVNEVVRNVLETVLRLFSELIVQFDCDGLILGGKPSSLPVIREVLVRLMPVPPDRIVGLKGYPVGSWYPFSQRGGGISDPKTTCVVGGAVWLFAERLRQLEGLTLATDDTAVRNRECFVGTYRPEVMQIDRQLFPTAAGQPQSVIELTGAVLLGARRVDVAVDLLNPLYELKVKPEEVEKRGPLRVTLQQDPKAREVLTVSRVEDQKGARLDVKLAELRLRTMASERYWLDTGTFDLS